MKKISFLSIVLIFLSYLSFAQTNTKDYKFIEVGFYNLENLFDTIVDPDTSKILTEEFTPIGKYKWNSQKYWTKIDNMARVISEIGTEINPDGLAVIGVSEIENESVLKDLVANHYIKNRQYKIVHYESPDRRGIDVALLYQEKNFTPEISKSIRLKIADNPDFRTRDQLVVSGKLDGEDFNFIVNHWPSRRGGEKRSLPYRIAAADLAKSIIDSLQNSNPKAKTILMGDLNDDPTSPSVKEHLKTAENFDQMKSGMLFNPFETLYKKGKGTLAYRDVWNLFDQMFLTPTLLGNDLSNYKFIKPVVFHHPYMIQQSGRYEGYPKRTFSFGVFQAGYSDHFPVFVILAKKK